MNGLCKAYLHEIKKVIPKVQVIFYGSNIYDCSSSDLDLCLIVEDELTQKEKEQLIFTTKNFQKSKNLKIDEEIPFSNKLIYTKKEVENVFTDSPFRNSKGEYIYHDIVKSKEFLNSPEMKKRLFLNILTTDHKSSGKVINDKYYEEKAWFEILTMLHNVFESNLKDINIILDNLYVNPVNFLAGEMYLGYKLANPNKKRYLKKKAKKYSKKLLKVLT